MKVYAYGATLLLLCASPGAAQAPVSGIGQAKDGDSLMVGGTEVRLFGIDAPEWDQYCRKNGQDWSCGSAAADKLAELVTGRNVVCSSVGMDEHKRVLGRCMAGATDVNRAMVASGYAVAFRRYSSDYVSAEDSAKVNKRGIWAGTFQMPSDYRHAGDAPVPVRTSRQRSEARLELCRATGRRGPRAAATSRATATGRASGSTTCPACPTTTRPGRRRSSAPRRRPGRRATGGRS